MATATTTARLTTSFAPQRMDFAAIDPGGEERSLQAGAVTTELARLDSPTC